MTRHIPAGNSGPGRMWGGLGCPTQVWNIPPCKTGWMGAPTPTAHPERWTEQSQSGGAVQFLWPDRKTTCPHFSNELCSSDECQGLTFIVPSPDHWLEAGTANKHSLGQSLPAETWSISPGSIYEPQSDSCCPDRQKSSSG